MNEQWFYFPMLINVVTILHHGQWRGQNDFNVGLLISLRCLDKFLVELGKFTRID